MLLPEQTVTVADRTMSKYGGRP